MPYGRFSALFFIGATQQCAGGRGIFGRMRFWPYVQSSGSSAIEDRIGSMIFARFWGVGSTSGL
ncbi:hypothetical protein VKT23_012552 [Stygiomarasmius scandens]|uniref:Secreted protein n=1 Tax=Marasmiellus scandens TaxID=2682957 RepID=A0ABR1J5K1_9AGAR